MTLQPRRIRGHRDGAGFSFVELITVLLLLGIVGVVVLPRLTGTQSFQNRLLVDQLIAIGRFAQQAALSRHNQSVTLALSRPADWLLVVEVDGSELKRLTPSRKNASLSLLSPSLLPIDGTTPRVIGFDNLGNVATLDGAPVYTNLSFDAAGKFFCLSLAGYAYEAASQSDCESN